MSSGGNRSQAQELASGAGDPTDDVDLDAHPSLLLLDLQCFSSEVLDCEKLDLSHLDGLTNNKNANASASCSHRLIPSLSIDLMRVHWGMSDENHTNHAGYDNGIAEKSECKVGEDHLNPCALSMTPPLVARQRQPEAAPSPLKESKFELEFPLIRRYRDGLKGDLDQNLLRTMQRVMQSKSQAGRRRGSEEGPVPTGYDPPTYEEILATLLLENPHMISWPDREIRAKVASMRTSRVHNRVDNWRKRAGWKKAEDGTWHNAQGEQWVRNAFQQ